MPTICKYHGSKCENPKRCEQWHPHKYDGDGHMETIDPERLTLGNVIRRNHQGGNLPTFSDCVIIGIKVELSERRQNRGLGKTITCETLAGALKEAQDRDFVVLTLARPYLYANNPFMSIPGALVGHERFEVFGERLTESFKVVVMSTGEYASFLSTPILHKWEVVAGNVGTVYDDLSESGARATYNAYVKFSKDGEGRVGGENVTLFRDGEIVEEHVGTKGGE